jgi:hypothetical protein
MGREAGAGYLILEEQRKEQQGTFSKEKRSKVAAAGYLGNSELGNAEF